MNIESLQSCLEGIVHRHLWSTSEKKTWRQEIWRTASHSPPGLHATIWASHESISTAWCFCSTTFSLVPKIAQRQTAQRHYVEMSKLGWFCPPFCHGAVMFIEAISGVETLNANHTYNNMSIHAYYSQQEFVDFPTFRSGRVFGKWIQILRFMRLTIRPLAKIIICTSRFLFTRLKTNILPENRWLEDETSF